MVIEARVERLAVAAAEAMETVEGATGQEVLSACFTLALRAAKVALRASTPASREHNRGALLELVAELYDEVKPPAAKVN